MTAAAGITARPTSIAKVPVVPKVQFTEGLLAERARCVREVVIPYQWEALNDRIPGAERSGTVHNFQVAAGEKSGAFHGLWFQDSDLAKWIEAASHRLRTHPDAALEHEIDGLIATIAKAQREDGYLDTYIQLVEPGKRWANLHEYHELYIAGHFIEAGAAHFEATGKRTLLQVVCRLADLIDRTFGRDPGKVRGYCGHEEIELALLKLATATGDQRYAQLAGYFVDERGAAPNYFEEEVRRLGIVELPPYFHGDRWAYVQAHRPVREQREPIGHAVRAMYLYTAMAMLARERADASLAVTCQTLWSEILARHLYLTGAVGAEWMGEKFGEPYDLPNDRAYAETCASIGLMMFARSMLDLELCAEYGDVMERALYNTVLAGMSQDGTRFFYVNPLEVTPNVAKRRYDCRQVKTQRVPWFGCACCPPNIARTLASLDRYAVQQNDEGIAIHLYAGARIETAIGGARFQLRMQTDYPWDERVRIEVGAGVPVECTVRLRIPSWCAQPAVTLNGKDVDMGGVRNGYLSLARSWQAGDVIELIFPMPIERVRADPRVGHAAGKVAVQRGPVVYCAEEVDNGANLAALRLRPESSLVVARASVDAEPVIEGVAVRELSSDATLYSTQPLPTEPARVRLVPYYRWNNRGEGEMRVWLRE